MVGKKGVWFACDKCNTRLYKSGEECPRCKIGKGIQIWPLLHIATSSNPNQFAGIPRKAKRIGGGCL